MTTKPRLSRYQELMHGSEPLPPATATQHAGQNTELRALWADEDAAARVRYQRSLAVNDELRATKNRHAQEGK